MPGNALLLKHPATHNLSERDLGDCGGELK